MRDYLSRLFDHAPGTRVATAHQGRDWVERVWAWPADADVMVRWMTELEEDVYICPAPRDGDATARLKGEGVRLMWLWADIDWKDVKHPAVVLERMRKLATFTVYSGSVVRKSEWSGEGWPEDTRVLRNTHVYVRLGREVTLDEHYTLNKKLRDLLEADNKHADNSLLRPPGTINAKDHTNVTNGPAWPSRVLSAAGIERWLADGLVSRRADGADDWTRVELPRLPGRVHAIVDMDEAEALARYGSRYKAVWAATRDLLALGLSTDVIHTLMDAFPPAVAKRAEEHGAYDVHRDVARCIAREGEGEGREDYAGLDVKDHGTLDAWEENLREGGTEAPPKPGGVWPDLGGVFSALTDDAGSLTPSFVTLSALVTMCSLMPRVTAMDGGATVRPNLYGVVVAPSGVGKTPVFDMVWGRLQELDAAEAQRAIDEERLLDKDAPPKPNGRHLVSSATYEGLMLRLERSRTQSALIAADELTAVTKAWGQYKNGAGNDEANILSAWEGKAIQSARVGTTARYIAQPFLSILGGVQPRYVGELGDLDRGSLSRYLFSWSTARPQERVPWVKGVGYDRYVTVVEELWATRGMGREYGWDQGAMEALREADGHWHAFSVRPDVPEAALVFYSKASNMTRKVALGLADIRRVADGRDGDLSVGRRDVEDARAIVTASVGQYLRHALRATAIRRAKQDDALIVNRLDEYLQRVEGTGQRYVTARQLQQARALGSLTSEELHSELMSYAKVRPKRIWLGTNGNRQRKLIFVSVPSASEIKALWAPTSGGLRYTYVPLESKGSD